MGLLDRLRGSTVDAMPNLTEADDGTAELLAQVNTLSEALRDEQNTNLHLIERAFDENYGLRQLEAENQGWSVLAAEADQEFTREGLRNLTAGCQLMALKNPLVKRGLALRHAYIWGRGVNVQAKAAGPTEENPTWQDVNTVVQEFIDDDGNEQVFTGATGQRTLERALGTDGNVFLALFTNPRTGRVRVRSIPFAEIVDKINNPQDRNDPWFYVRRWTEVAIVEGRVTSTERVELHPALSFYPTVRARKVEVDGALRDVRWDAPVEHVAGDLPQGWKWGIPDAYAAIDWARAYKDLLTDWVRLFRSLSRYAWKITSTGARSQRTRDAVARAPRDLDGSNAGATAIVGPDQNVEAVPKTGATIDADSGRPVLAMVAAALDVPVTQLSTDPGITGARATAETLDRPTELMAQGRQAVWTTSLVRIYRYVIEQAVAAPDGPLIGTVTRPDPDGPRVITLAGDTPWDVDIAWPAMDDVAMDVLVAAITNAEATGLVPDELVARLLIAALGVTDVDAWIEAMRDPDTGEIAFPKATAAQAAVDAFRDGGDPAATLRRGEDPSTEPDPVGQGAGA